MYYYYFSTVYVCVWALPKFQVFLSSCLIDMVTIFNHIYIVFTVPKCELRINIERRKLHRIGELFVLCTLKH